MKLEKAIKFKNGKKRNYEIGNIPVYGGNGILGYTNNYNAEKNNIIIGRVGAYCGCVYRNNDECWISDNAIVGNVKEGFDYNFIYYLLKSINLNSLHIGSSHPLMTQEILNNIEINIPAYDYQKRAAKILNIIDQKIELNIQTNDNLLNLAKLKFEEWLTSCDEKLFIKDMADEILDYNKNNNEKVKLLNSSDVTLGNFPKIDFVDNKDLKGHFKKRFQKYDVLYSQIRPRNMHFGYALMDDYNDYIASTRLMVVRNKKDIVSSSVLYFYLTSREAIEDFTLKTESRSGTFPQGNYEDLSSFKVKYSSDQDEITKSLDLTLEKIYFNNKQNETLEQLRDTLLPKLMNGEIDLDKIEI